MGKAHAVARMRANGAQHQGEAQIGMQGPGGDAPCPECRQFCLGNAEVWWGIKRGLIGEPRADAVAGEAGDQGRRVVQDRARPICQQLRNPGKNRGVFEGFAHGHKGHVMLWQVIQRHCLGIDITQQKQSIRAFQQEIERRVGHEIARRHESKQARAGAVAMHHAIVAAQPQGALHLLHRLGAAPMALQDHREVQQRCGVGTQALQAGHQAAGKGADVGLLERDAGDGGHADKAGSGIGLYRQGQNGHVHGLTPVPRQGGGCL
ncbi:hypothetical protein GALL_550750 [mine drainage metagenome]|uniref:Uncharacterized protein n=1 Tax=mine drainage metagenome TaxID=410659 RepID=A0A1J5NYS6_9ZZZZ